MQTIVGAIQQSADTKEQTEIIAKIAPYLPEALLREVLTISQTIGDEWEQTQTMRALSPYL